MQKPNSRDARPLTLSVRTLKRMMPKQPILIFLIFLISLFVVPSAGNTLLIDRVVAIVNHEVITLSELQESALLSRQERKTDALKDMEGLFHPNTLRLLLQEEIDKKLQLQEAQKKGFSPSESELEDALEGIKTRNGLVSDIAFERALAKESLTLDQFKKDLREKLTILQLVNREITSGMVVEEEELKALYEKRKTDYPVPPRVRISEIFLKIDDPEDLESVREKKKLADTLIEKLDQGEDFENLAQQYSERSEPDLGYFKPGDLLSPLNETAFSLSVGQVSQPVQSTHGMHILQVTEKNQDDFRAFEAVKDEIREELLQMKSVVLHQEWLRALRLKSHVEIKF